MSLQDLKEFLLWSALINYAVLFIWFGVFICAHDWLYRTQQRWFKLSVETFDALSYGGVGIYKIGIFLFNVAPLAALLIVR